MRLNRIVVGTDFSTSCVDAVQWTATLIAPRAELILAHVVDVPQPPRFLRGRFPQSAMVADLARQGAEDKLGELVKTLAHGRIQTRVLIGRPADHLAELARKVDADAIVVGKHCDRGSALARIGGVAEQLLRVSPVPVLLATGLRDAPPRRILVALDDADVTPSVVDWTRTLADSFGANVTAFHVMSSAVMSHVLSMTAVTTGKETFTEAEIKQEFRDETDRWMRKLIGSGLDPARVTSEVAFGEAGQEILWAAERLACDLIVLGRRGGGGVRRFFLGSVAREVVTGARCPVFVVVEPIDEIVSESAENGGEHPQE